MAKLKPILASMGAVRSELLRAADGVPVTYWETRPAEDCWSAAEVIAHLTLVEWTLLAVIIFILADLCF